jgi:hypothetical protein
MLISKGLSVMRDKRARFRDAGEMGVRERTAYAGKTQRRTWHAFEKTAKVVVAELTGAGR